MLEDNLLFPFVLFFFKCFFIIFYLFGMWLADVYSLPMPTSYTAQDLEDGEDGIQVNQAISFVR